MSGFKGLVYLFNLCGWAHLKKSPVLLPLLAALSLAVVPVDLNAHGKGPEPGKPSWISSHSLSSDSGYGQLEWEQKPGEAVEVFRLKEKYNGKTSYSFVSGRELKIYRATPGQYQFRISACVKDSDGYPICGAKSAKLNFVVTEAIYDPLIEAAADVNTTASPVEASVSLAAVVGGPNELRPGLWYNPAKSGHGWSFYWANRLALSSNPQNTYDLYGIWYTYEAKTRLITPICEPPDPPCGFEIELLNYRPLVATMQLVQTRANTFSGGIFVTRNGTTVHEGTATITFSGTETSASINWDVNFKHESLADQEVISLLIGEDASPFGDPTNFTGLWEPTSGAGYFIIDDIGTTAELVEVVFYDDDGDPVWIQAGNYRTLTENNTSLCFYYIDGGYAPDLTGSIPTDWFAGSGCDFNAAASSSNRNGRRYFPDWEAGRYWVNFTLPVGAGGNAPAGGSVSIGSSTSPAHFSKQANFHRIYSTGGNSCDISPSVTSCNAVLTWFTDGDYPGATAFAYNQTTGQRSTLATSTAPAMEKQLAALSVAGNYVFELRMTASTESRLIAESAPFAVIKTLDLPMAPGNLNVVWTNEAVRAFRVGWSDANTPEVDYYKLEEDDPTANPITSYTISPGINLERDFAYSTGPFGTYRYRVKACSTASGSEVCSGFTAWLNWQLSDPKPSTTTEHPWGDNVYGTQSTNITYNYAMGYHFKPAVNGSITELGGLFNGTKTVKLFQRGGPELASAIVTANNSWTYLSIAPVAVTAGVEYTVAVYLSGSGGAQRTGVIFPQTFGQIEIVGSTWASTASNPNAIPNTRVSTTTMYGQADIGFEAGGPPLVPPVITAINKQQQAEGDSPSVQVLATDADGTITSFADGGTLPAGLSINNTGLISGTIAAGAAAASPYRVTITVTDNDGLTDQDTFIWTIDPAPDGACVDVFVDDFESDQGWLRNLQGTDTARKGRWKRSNPESTAYNGVIYQLGSTPSGLNSLVTDGRAGTSAYTYDVDGGPTSIFSPTIDLPAGGSAYQLQFDYNFAYRSSTSSSDRFVVYAVSGSTETLLFEEVDDNSSSHPGVWKFKTIDLSAFASQTISIKFVADDDAAKGSLVEGQVDDVRVCYIPSTTNAAPVVIQPADQSSIVGQAISPLVVQVSDAEGDAVTCSITGLPAGLSESKECTITGTVSAAMGDYTVSVTASDGQLTASPVTFTWTIVQVTTTSTPEVPPDPVAMPSMVKDSISSRVGATVGTFRVDEAGSATYSIALITAPGSGGMAPQISLNYSSQLGNGPLGVGWSLGGLSAITRCSQTLAQDGAGAARGITLTATDRFCLDGQRLLAVAGTYGASNTQYRTEVDGIAKIISFGNAGTGPAYFKVWRKDGSVTEYGNTPDSRIEARTASDKQTVLVWTQNRISDSAANYMDYEYTELTGAAVEFVLASVKYTGNSGTVGTAPYAELEFSYTGGRPDATTHSLAGSTIAQTQLLTRVDSRARATASGSMDSLRSYFLNYHSDGYGRKILNSVTACSDSGGTICFNPTQFAWQISDHEISTSGISVGGVFSDKQAGLALADINGDARPDLLLSEKKGKTFRFRIAISQPGGGFAEPRTTTYAIPENGTTNQPVALYTIDLNADGFQDVIYPSSTEWRGRLSNGSSLGSEFTVTAGCCGLSAPPFVRIMDFDGDGLSDLVTNRTSGGQGLELVLLRNLFSPSASNTVGFAAAEGITVNLPADLFPDQSAGGWIKDVEVERLTEAMNKNLRHAKTFDYNGDGAVDVLVKLSQRYTQCTSGCNPSLRASLSGTLSGSSQFIFNSEPATVQGETEAFAEFFAVLLSARNPANGSYQFNVQQIIATGSQCAVFDACNPYADLPRVQDALPVDINADGLADFAFRDASDQWKVRVNLGGAFANSETFIMTQTDEQLAKQSHFQDLNGDGYPEFLYPSRLGSSAAVWIVHQNSYGTGYSAAMPTTVKFGNSDEGDSSILVDFNADGMLDNLLVDFNGRGKLHSTTTQVYPGQNSAGGSNDLAVNLLARITDGFGAQTTISYKPLTDAAVYTRMHDAKNADWDAGYAVYDLIAPIYVVSQAVSSAPLFGSPQASSQVEYHYVGAKLQGGGRGFLGFGEVISYDPQAGIRTNTRYRQDYPFTGRPGDTTQALANSRQKFDSISNTASLVPVNWPVVSVVATTQPPALPSGTLLSYAINQWTAIETIAGQATRFPFIAASLERSYTLAGNFNRKVLTTNTYDSYGDLITAVVKTYATDGRTVFATQTSTNSYLTANTTQWHLGRLSQSIVTHTRSGEPSITRTSSFGYAGSSGILNQEVIEPSLSAFKVTTTYQLDSFGNRTSTTVSGAGFAARRVSSAYDPLGRFVIETRNAYKQSSQKVISWDAFGNALEVENIDGVRTTTAADHMGRPFISYTETGAWSKTIQRVSAGSYCPAGETAFYILTTGGGRPSQYRCFDVLGREIRTATQGFNGSMVHVDRYYDESGRPERVSEPYFATGSRYWNRTAYDALGRIDSVLAADGNDQTWDYDEAASGCSIAGGPRQVKTTNGLGQSRLEVRNAQGEAVSVYDNDCGAISYRYDAMGNLTRVTGADGVVTATTYDLAGRKTSMDDPDKGAWQYAYNPLGELTRQLDAKNQAIDFSYDLLGRVTDRRELSNVASLTDTAYTSVNREITTWNNSTSASVMGKSRITQTVYREGESSAIVHQRDRSYDSFGRPRIVSTSQDGLQLAEETTYDQYGRVFQQFDASGDNRGLRYVYNAQGYLDQLKEAREGVSGTVYQNIEDMDARGQVTYLILGNGVEAFAGYQGASGRLQRLEAFDDLGIELQEVDYIFDVLGNLTQRHDRSTGQDLKEVFAYDNMNRLSSVYLTAPLLGISTPAQTLSLTYRAAGNITNKSDVGNYLYGQNGAGPHAVTRAGGVTYRYDANGNQVSGDGRSITYTVFDKPDSIAMGAAETQFAYGIGHNRYRRVDRDSGVVQKTTLYFGVAERITEGTSTYFKRYLGGVVIATFYPATGAQQVNYLLKDHLGSIHTITNEAGQVVATMHFGAFGERQGGNWQTPLSGFQWAALNDITTRGYTGHEQVDEMGIVHMNGRIYDPQLGRFLQADPFVQAPKNSQSLNRYSYVLNNPLSYTDPSGYFSLKKLVSKVRPFVAIGLTIAAPWGTGFWATIATGAFSGYIAAGNIQGALIGAFSAAAFYGIGQHFAGVANANPKVYRFVGRSGLRPGQFAQKIAAHGIAGGVMSELRGGKFGHGFLSAGFTQALAGPIGAMQTPPDRIIAAAVVGGTVSELTGGKFSNGALTGAFSRGFNDEIHSPDPFVGMRTIATSIKETLSDLFSKTNSTINSLLGPREKAGAAGIEGSFTTFVGIVGGSVSKGFSFDSNFNACSITSSCFQLGLGAFLGGGMNGLLSGGDPLATDRIGTVGFFFLGGNGPASGASLNYSQDALSVGKAFFGTGLGGAVGFQFCGVQSNCIGDGN